MDARATPGAHDGEVGASAFWSLRGAPIPLPPTAALSQDRWVFVEWMMAWVWLNGGMTHATVGVIAGEPLWWYRRSSRRRWRQTDAASKQCLPSPSLAASPRPAALQFGQRYFTGPVVEAAVRILRRRFLDLC